MPDYITFENWPLSMRLREMKDRSNKIKASAVSTTPELDEATQFKLRIMSIIDVLLKELESM